MEITAPAPPSSPRRRADAATRAFIERLALAGRTPEDITRIVALWRGEPQRAPVDASLLDRAKVLGRAFILCDRASTGALASIVADLEGLLHREGRSTLALVHATGTAVAKTKT